MKKYRQNTFPVSIAAILAALAIILASASGCATRGDVREIVNQSNAQLLMSQIDRETFPSAAPSGAGGSRNDVPQWLAVSNHIDNFIVTHPDQPRTAAALRIRQAMVLLSHGKYNLARASFDMIENPEHLTTDRDRALFNLKDVLIWWYGLNKKTAMGWEDFSKADDALKRLQTQVEQVKDSPRIRDWLAELRAWIALYSARKIPDPEMATKYIQDGINQYAKIFSPTDMESIKTAGTAEQWKESPEGFRRQLRPMAVIKYAKQVIQSAQVQPRFVGEWNAILLNSPGSSF